MAKEKIKHWILIDGKPIAVTRTRQQMRRKFAEMRKSNIGIVRQKDSFYYAGKVLSSGSIIIVNCGRGL